MPPPETCIVNEVINWILKEFKGQHAGDYLEITQHLQEKELSQGAYKYFITEARISFRTEVYKKGLDQDDMQRMRDELDRITGDSIKKIEFMESTAARYTNESSSPSSGGSALLLKIEIFHKEQI